MYAYMYNLLILVDSASTFVRSKKTEFNINKYQKYKNLISSIIPYSVKL